MTAPAIALRPCRADDAGVMARLVHAGFASYESFAPDWAWPREEGEEADELRTRLADDATWSAVAETGGAAIGFVLFVPARTSWRAPLEDDRAHLRSLFVDAAHRGTGVAGRLLARAVAAAGARGFTSMRLFTPSGHGRACRFYEREGWAATGEPFSSDFGLPLLEYRRPLP